MYFNIRITIILLIVSTLILSCNIFNPSGKSKGRKSDDANILIEDGYIHLRSNQYTQAAIDFNKAIKIDSTKSEAWYGLAKANIRARNINTFELVNIISYDTSQVFPFVNDSKEVQNRFYQALVELEITLNQLARRDTLTTNWKRSLLKESDIEAWNALTELQRKRAENFIETNTIALSEFPLSDQIITFGRISIDYSICKLSTTVLKALDFNSDGSIDDNDFNIFNILPSSGLDSASQAQAISDLVSDRDFADIANDKILSVTNDLTDIHNLLGEVNDDLGGIIDDLLPVENTDQDSTSLNDSTVAANQLEEVINDLGDGINFYLLGDARDNDGDGCIDEEIYDQRDNDGDGFVDEDLRVAELNLLDPQFALDLIDNDFNGQIDEDDEKYTSSDLATATDPKKLLLPFTVNFTTNIEGYINSPSKELKLAVAADTTGNTYSLSQRKQLIAGCWSYYSESDFTDYLELHYGP